MSMAIFNSYIVVITKGYIYVHIVSSIFYPSTTDRVNCRVGEVVIMVVLDTPKGGLFWPPQVALQWEMRSSF